MVLIEDGTLITLMGMLCSLVLNVVLLVTNSKKRNEQRRSDDVLIHLSKLYLVDSDLPFPARALENVSLIFEDKTAKRVIDRTIGVELSKSQKMQAFGKE